jgi:phosphoglycolate phosphatase-like HAD superfamily hydrolase
MSLNARFDLIVFDFDGTLCDSTDVKTEAFSLLYLDERGPAFAERVRAYHLANAGVSRYDKIRHIESEMLGSEPAASRVDQIAARFGEIVERQVIAAPLFDGVVEFLETATSPLAVASATPTDELRRIVDAKGLAQHFVAVEGSPRSKGEILSAYVTQFATDPCRVLMVGDQPSDRAAAEEAATHFIAIVAPDDAREWAAPYRAVSDFTSFAAIAAGHVAPIGPSRP